MVRACIENLRVRWREWLTWLRQANETRELYMGHRWVARQRYTDVPKPWEE